jgi:hypothetical protein
MGVHFSGITVGALLIWICFPRVESDLHSGSAETNCLLGSPYLVVVRLGFKCKIEMLPINLLKLLMRPFAFLLLVYMVFADG